MRPIPTLSPIAQGLLQRAGLAPTPGPARADSRALGKNVLRLARQLARQGNSVPAGLLFQDAARVLGATSGLSEEGRWLRRAYVFYRRAIEQIDVIMPPERWHSRLVTRDGDFAVMIDRVDESHPLFPYKQDLGKILAKLNAFLRIGRVAAQLGQQRDYVQELRERGNFKAAALVTIAAGNEALVRGRLRLHQRLHLQAAQDLEQAGLPHLANRLLVDLDDFYGEPHVRPHFLEIPLPPLATFQEVQMAFGELKEDFWETVPVLAGLKPVSAAISATDEAVRALEANGLVVLYLSPEGDVAPTRPAPDEPESSILVYHPEAIDYLLSQQGERFGIHQYGRTAREVVCAVFQDWESQEKPVGLFLGYDPMTVGLDLAVQAPFSAHVRVGDWGGLIYFRARNLENGRAIAQRIGDLATELAPRLSPGSPVEIYAGIWGNQIEENFYEATRYLHYGWVKWLFDHDALPHVI